MDNNALPIWYDQDQQAQFHVPECLAKLTIAEKMVIQLASPFIPLKHMKNGIMGLTGHVCAFEQDIEGFAKSVPRRKDDATLLQVLKVIKNEHEVGALDIKGFSDFGLADTRIVNDDDQGRIGGDAEAKWFQRLQQV